MYEMQGLRGEFISSNPMDCLVGILDGDRYAQVLVIEKFFHL